MASKDAAPVLPAPSAAILAAYFAASAVLGQPYHGTLVLPLFYLSALLYVSLFKKPRWGAPSLVAIPVAVISHHLTLALLCLAGSVHVYAAAGIAGYAVLAAEAAVEEMYFRHAVYLELAAAGRFRSAASAALFMLFHAPVFSVDLLYRSAGLLPAYFFLGLSLQEVYRKRGLATAAAAHVLYNLISLNYSLTQTPLSLAVVVAAHAAGYAFSRFVC